MADTDRSAVIDATTMMKRTNDRSEAEFHRSTHPHVLNNNFIYDEDTTAAILVT